MALRFEQYLASELRSKIHENKQRYIQDSIGPIYTAVLHAARYTSSYFHKIVDEPNSRINMIPPKWEYIPTNEEKVDMLKKIFPDCSVTYEEVWVEDPLNADIKIRVKGIQIDWS